MPINREEISNLTKSPDRTTLIECGSVIECLNFVRKAMRHVQENYLSLVVADGTSDGRAISRERVYAYELYHQMRLIQEQGQFRTIDINAEVDKRAHPIILESFNPDIILHQQGSMSYNLCVIEIKMKLERGEIKNDFEKLLIMVSQYDYKCGMFVLIHSSVEDLMVVMEEVWLTEENINNQYTSQIYIFAQNGDKFECQTLNAVIQKLQQEKVHG